MIPLNKIFLGLLACLILVACSALPEKNSALHEQATRQSEHGAAAFVQGDFMRAAREYEAALLTNQAIENAAGIAIARINLARVARAVARYDLAHAYLNFLFGAPVLAYPDESLAAAATLQAQLYFEQGDTNSAAQWLARSTTICQKKCAVSASLLLMRAQLAMREQNYVAARAWVDEAIAALAAPQQAIELANAQRLSGEIYFANADDEHASAQFQAALQLDQKLGLPAKIEMDLSRLAQVSAHAGRVAEARNYSERASLVGQALRAATQANTTAH